MHVPLSVKRYFLVLSICLTAIFFTLITVQSPVIFQVNQYITMQGAVKNEIEISVSTKETTQSSVSLTSFNASFKIFSPTSGSTTSSVSVSNVATNKIHPTKSSFTEVTPPTFLSISSTPKSANISQTYSNITTTPATKAKATEPPPNIACQSSKTTYLANLNYTELDLLEGNFEFTENLLSGGTWRSSDAHSINISIDDKKFNRAALFNVGFIEAAKMNDSNDCYFFHDVDAIPESGNLTYCCSSNSVIHYASAMSTKSWRMPYGSFFGGVVAATAAQFRKANGFPNRFWGWGGEDDEFRMRVQTSGQKISRLPITEGRYFMFKHDRDKGNEANPERMKKLGETGKIWQTEGLNSANYTLKAVLRRKFYTEFQVIFN